MTEPLQVGQFGIVDHEPVDRGPNAGVFHGKGPAGERAELFVVGEGTTPAGEAFAPHVVSALGHSWTTLDMSLTGALRRSFLEAERHVGEWNRKSIAQHRVSIGITCFARNADYAVVAQAGPAIAFHLSGRHMDIIAPQDDHATAMDGTPTVEPQFTRISFKPGDRLLVLSTAAIAELDDELVAGILSLPAEQVLQDLYRRVKHLRNLTVVLIESPDEFVRADDASANPDYEIGAPPKSDIIIGGTQTGERDHGASGFQPSLFLDSPDPAALTEVEAAREKLTHIADRARLRTARVEDSEVSVAPLQRVVGDSSGLLRLAEESRERANAGRAASAVGTSLRPEWNTASTGRPVAIASASRRELVGAGVATATASGSNGAGGFPGGQPDNGAPHANDTGAEAARNSVNAASASFSRSLVRPRQVARPQEEPKAAPLASDMAASLRNRGTGNPGRANSFAAETPSPAQLGGSPLVRPRSNMGGRWKGGGSLSRRSTVSGTAPPTRLVVGVGLGLLLLLVGFFALPGLMDSNNAGRAAELVDTASRQITIAQVQTDPAAQRSALTEAKALLLEAEQVGGVTTDTQRLINEVAGAITVLDAVTAPARVELIADLSAYGEAPVTPADISIGTNVAYLMDTTSAQVISQPLDGQLASVVYQQDETIGTTRPIALAYQGVNDRLLIATANGTLWGYDASTGLNLLVLNVPVGTQLTDIATYGGDLYILDANAGKIVKMTAVGDDFPFEPVVVRDDPVLRTAVRMLVDEEVIVSLADGSLQRFSGQLTLTLSQAGIDKTLTAAASPWVLPDGGIALPDAANDRIVVLGRDGTFLRQYRHEELIHVASMAARDDAGYVFSNGKLMRVTW